MMRAYIEKAVLFALTLGVVAKAAPRNTSSDCLPVVDLGYEVHQALAYDNKTDSYLFQNIRYAKSPTLNLRFRAPAAPDIDRSEIKNGAGRRICPQAAPVWQTKVNTLLPKYFNPKQSWDIAAWREDLLKAEPVPGDALNNIASEDCLFLDVRVPKKVLRRSDTTDGAPVLVFIHGGGGVLGAKDGVPNPYFFPTGILHEASQHEDGLIFISINYRLGALGFLASPEVDNDGDLNAGLLDQRLALQWVQANIHLFGGDKSRVTVMGESGGGGSIMAHLTAYGGTEPALFSAVIPQSPASIPTFSNPEGSYEKFLSYVNVSSLTEARDVDQATIMKANAAQINDAPATSYVHGLVLDGKLIRQPPVASLKEGSFHKSVNVLTARNINEGAFLMDPTINTSEDLRAWAQRSVPGMDEKTMDILLNEIYPPIYDGSQGYTDDSTRQVALMGELLIDCNFQQLGEITGGNTYAYQFAVSPGLHVQDLRYTFNDPAVPMAFPEAQRALQRAIVSFAQGGVPLMVDGSPFPKWGTEGSLVNITETGAHVDISDVNKRRCDWWRDFQMTL